MLGDVEAYAQDEPADELENAIARVARPEIRQRGRHTRNVDLGVICRVDPALGRVMHDESRGDVDVRFLTPDLEQLVRYGDRERVPRSMGLCDGGWGGAVHIGIAA